MSVTEPMKNSTMSRSSMNTGRIGPKEAETLRTKMKQVLASRSAGKRQKTEARRVAAMLDGLMKAKRKPKSGVSETTKTEKTEAGEQTIIPGVGPVTDRARAEVKLAKPKRGGNAPMQDTGLFGDPLHWADLFDESAKATEISHNPSEHVKGRYR